MTSQSMLRRKGSFTKMAVEPDFPVNRIDVLLKCMVAGEVFVTCLTVELIFTTCVVSLCADRVSTFGDKIFHNGRIYGAHYRDCFDNGGAVHTWSEMSYHKPGMKSVFHTGAGCSCVFPSDPCWGTLFRIFGTRASPSYAMFSTCP